MTAAEATSKPALTFVLRGSPGRGIVAAPILRRDGDATAKSRAGGVLVRGPALPDRLRPAGRGRAGPHRPEALGTRPERQRHRHDEQAGPVGPDAPDR